MDAHRDFATSMVQTMMYAGDIFTDKLEKAKKIMSADVQTLAPWLAVKARLSSAEWALSWATR